MQQAQLIRIGGDGINEDYFIQFSDTKKFFLSLTKESDQNAYQFKLFDMSGNIVSSSSQSNGRTADWYGCFMNWFNDLCGGFWNAIMCDAAAIACPECMAIVLIAIGVSCMY